MYTGDDTHNKKQKYTIYKYKLNKKTISCKGDETHGKKHYCNGQQRKKIRSYLS